MKTDRLEEGKLATMLVNSRASEETGGSNTT
jgi:hypothetical protein